MAELKVCPHCGCSQNAPEDNRCYRCGKDLDAEPTPAPETASLRAPAGIEIVVAGIRVSLDVGDRLLLGRQSNNDQVAQALARFGNVSRMHATIEVPGGGVVRVADINSLNGTFAGDVRLVAGAEATPLPLPVTLRLAHHCFVDIRARGG